MAEDYSILSDPEMKEIFDSFIIETKEILEKLDTDLVDLEKKPRDSELLNAIFRAFHTVKGTSGFLGLGKLSKVTHVAEDILNKLRKGEIVVNERIMEGILKAYDKMAELLECIESNKNEDVEVNNTIELLKNVLSETISEPATKPEKPSLPEAEPVVIPVNEPEKTEKAEKQLSDIIPTVQADSEEKNEVHEDEIHPEKEASGVATKTETKTRTDVKSKGDNTIRVDVERLDELLNIVSELVLGRNRLSQISSEVQVEHEGTKLSRELSDAAKQIDLMTTELQLAVMKTRMIKIGKVFNKFPRVIRDLSREFNKDIELIISGEDTELDKTVIEEINDPLVHLVRNSIDHGIEPLNDRIKKNKEPKGTIKLIAEQEGNNIVITIEDDGKGIDPEVIKRKAIEKGLITPEKVKDLSKNDIFNFIFLPGFSTAEKVTSVSGRGVGMDVVKTNVTKLRGVINVESEINKGTKIIIKLPLTLAIIQGLLVEVDAETVVIPLYSVIEVVRASNEEIYTVNRQEVIRVRDGVLPLLRINKLLYKTHTSKDVSGWNYIVVLGLAEKRLGVLVDNLVGQKEVVIKSLGNFLGNIRGIAGSTIMGDGRVVMILDIVDLINSLDK